MTFLDGHITTHVLCTSACQTGQLVGFYGIGLRSVRLNEVPVARVALSLDGVRAQMEI